MQTLTYSVQRGSRQRWMLLAVLLTIAALILSACGAKIETQLGLESADKGVRTMQVSFDLKDNQDKIKGGTQALDASLRKHLPSGLEYGVSSPRATRPARPSPYPSRRLTSTAPRWPAS